MKILAIESSAKAASVALCEDGTLISQYYQASGLTHSRTLLSMTEALLSNLETKVTDLDGIAVAKGPGSFTGIRIGIAAAKGLAWGAELPLCGVSTLEAMAYHGTDDRFIICPVMDARRSQVYNALFSASDRKPSRITADRAISLEELMSDAKQFDKPFYFIGDGANLCFEAFKKAGITCSLAPENLRLQSAWGVASAAMNLSAFEAPGLLEPNYLRLSQAERERLARLSHQESKNN